MHDRLGSLVTAALLVGAVTLLGFFIWLAATTSTTRPARPAPTRTPITSITPTAVFPR